MPVPKAPLLDAKGKASKDVTLEAEIFGAELKPHLVHETVRAEFNERRSGTRAAKSRGLVSGGRSKPWRQKGTGRARQGTIRAPQFTGGGVAFPPIPRDFEPRVPARAAFSSARTASCTRCGFSSAAKTASSSETSFFAPPSTGALGAATSARPPGSPRARSSAPGRRP